MVAHKVTIRFRNDHWYQVGKYLVVKQIEKFKAHQICIIKDEETLKAIKQVVKNDLTNESFIALETNHKVNNSVLSK